MQQFDPSKQPPAFAAFDQFLADTAEVNARRWHVTQKGLQIYGYDDEELYAFRKAWNTAIELCYDVVVDPKNGSYRDCFDEIQELKCPL